MNSREGNLYFAGPALPVTGSGNLMFKFGWSGGKGRLAFGATFGPLATADLSILPDASVDDAEIPIDSYTSSFTGEFSAPRGILKFVFLNNNSSPDSDFSSIIVNTI
jgi:hypothetical protein